MDKKVICGVNTVVDGRTRRHGEESLAHAEKRVAVCEFHLPPTQGLVHTHRRLHHLSDVYRVLYDQTVTNETLFLSNTLYSYYTSFCLHQSISLLIALFDATRPPT